VDRWPKQSKKTCSIPWTLVCGAGAAEAVNPSEPLAQVQFQNYFAPHTYGFHGYANTFVLQPCHPHQPQLRIVPVSHHSADASAHRWPRRSQGGIGDLTIVDVFVHPFKEIKTSAGAGYIVIAPTATDPDLGPREWFLGPAVFAITTAVPKWVIGALVQTPISLQSNAYQAQMQPIVTRLFEDDWYVGWGDTLLTLNDQDGHYNLPLSSELERLSRSAGNRSISFCRANIRREGFKAADRNNGPSN
jgi:hypothetical protein